jgi:hypothetical protein
VSWRWVRPLPVLFLLLLGGTLRAQQCSRCDCNHFPIEVECEGCCGYKSGTITSVTNSSVVISEKESTSDSVTAEKTFALTPDTKKNADLKDGAQATVYYRKQGNVATKVDLLNELSGLLVPSDEPDPPLPSSCYRMGPFPPDALRVYLGGNVGYTTSDEVSVLNVKGTDVIDLRRTSKGLAINAKTFSGDGKVIAEIVDNRFYVNPNNFFRIEKQDSHSLIVHDLQGRKVMDIRYINSHSVSVLGIFQVPGAPPLVVDEKQLTLGPIHLTGSCASGRTLFKYD